MPQGNHRVWKGMAAGLAGGLAGAGAMGLLLELAKSWTGQKKKRTGEDSTVKAASAISKSLTGHRLTKKEKPIAGQIVHYATGGVSGAIYGAVSEVLPLATAGFGTLFGSAMWLAADEVAVPALRLGPAPDELSLSHHAQYLGAHLIYGAITDAVRRGLLTVM